MSAEDNYYEKGIYNVRNVNNNYGKNKNEKDNYKHENNNSMKNVNNNYYENY